MSFNGKGQVFIKALNPTKINGVNYSKDEVVCYFNNAEFTIGYSLNSTSAGKSQRILMSNNEKNAQTITINVAGLKTGIWRLIGTRSTETEIEKPKATKVIADADGNVFLPVNGRVITLAVSDAITLEKIEEPDFTEDGMITGLESGKSYVIMYNEMLPIEVGHTLNSESIPYLYIQFVQEHSTGSLLIKVPKVSLAMTPNFDFNSENLINIPINFLVIDSDVEIYEYE